MVSRASVTRNSVVSLHIEVRKEKSSAAHLPTKKKKAKYKTHPSLRILLVSSSARLFVSVKMRDLFSASPMISSRSLISLIIKIK